MTKRAVLFFLLALTILPIMLVGCKGKVEKAAEEQKMEAADTTPALPSEGQEVLQPGVNEPAQNVAAVAIPPSATPQIAEGAAGPAVKEWSDREKEIQVALKNAGFYAGAIDGKIGPKTKKAVEEFQKAKGLKVDGKAGPKTWAELEKYLA